MSTLADVRVSASEFALGETFSNVPEAEFKVQTVASHHGERRFPLLKEMDGNGPTVTSAFEDDPTVESAEVLTDAGDGYMFEMQWSEQPRAAVDALLEEGVTVLDAGAAEGEWQFSVQATDRATMSDAFDACQDAGFPIALETIHEQRQLTDSPAGLTTDQYETLDAAIEDGYYEVPRDCTTEELADGFDLSHQAVSERLRRAHEKVVAHVLTGT